MSLTGVAALLGGTKTLGREIRNSMDLIELSQSGITKESLLSLLKYMGGSLQQFAELLPVTGRTIQRYPDTERFNSAVSESIFHIATVVAKGVEVFGDKEAALEWLGQPCAALAGQTPRSLLKSRFGAEMVLDELIRIEHGVFS
ncbi:DUF2384 domain-containing protein [Candidatus Bipolaricaulota bacterium]|nr:DUF2384 domain-containing protein [Candidatus Bipolaricaulota bacterium]